MTASWVGNAETHTAVFVATALIYGIIMYFTRRGSQAAALLDIMNQLQHEEMRHARYRLYNETGSMSPSVWRNDLRNDVERVCQLYGTIGMLMRAHLIPRRAFLRNSGHTVIVCHRAAETFIVWRAGRDGREVSDMWPNFRWLKHNAQLYEMNARERAWRRVRHPFSGPGGFILTGVEP